MIQPKRAPVKPRVLCPASGEALPLEDEVRALLEAGARGVVEITGPAGAGKTTALRHLAAVLPPSDRVKFLNCPPNPSTPPLSHHLLFCAGPLSRGVSRVASYPLAGWNEDEWLEYLLAVHPAACANVLARLRAAPDRPCCPPLPALWVIVLDQMAADGAVRGVRDALRRFVQNEVPLSSRQGVRLWCLAAQRQFQINLKHSGCSPKLLTALQYPTVQVMLAAEQIVEDLVGGPRGILVERLPRLLVREVGAAASNLPAALDRLHQLMDHGHKEQ
jgi:energy-coupling factor transporter ATP-binding protein EcfA2